MHKHDSGKTRVTVERVTVTTIRRGGRIHPVYCEICRELIGQPDGQPLLTEGEVLTNDTVEKEETNSQ